MLNYGKSEDVFGKLLVIQLFQKSSIIKVNY